MLSKLTYLPEQKMKIDLKEWIENNLIGKTGKIISFKMNEKWLVKNIYNIYLCILKGTQYLDNIENLKFAERLYHIVNGLDIVQKCEKENCNNFVSYFSFNRGYLQYCSSYCSSSSKEVKDKIKEVCLKKYGSSSPLGSKKIRKKIKETCLKKYGFECALQSKEIIDKIKKTNLLKLGVDYPLKSKKVRDKAKQSYENNYKNNPAAIKALRDKIKKTCIEKYGVDHPWKNEKIKAKIKKANSNPEIIAKSNKKRKITIRYKYGVDNLWQSSEIKKKILSKNNGYWPTQKIVPIDILDKLNNKKFVENIYNKYKNCQLISEELGVCQKTVLNYVHKHNIPIIKQYSSSFEKEIIKFINQKNIKTNSRNIISPYEIDIYLPKIKLAIEFDGLYWHSHDRKETSKQKKYHMMKTKMCEEKDIQLLHIFENEWLNPIKQGIWKSIINSKLDRNKKVDSKKCEVKQITNNSLIRNFLNNNHYRGFIKSGVNIGLFCCNELISLMTFNKSKSNSKINHFKIISFCNKKNINIVGGISKLFKFFIINYNPDSITSCVDRRRDNGKLYETLGFEYSHNSKPNYFYFKPRENILYSKARCKKLLEKYDDKLPSHENMFNNNYRRIWDCGNMIFIWKKQII